MKPGAASVLPGVDEVWVINLDRRPDRLGRFFKNHPELAGVAKRFPAFDGRKLEPSPALARLYLPNDFAWHRPTLGCSLSHLALWQRLADEPDGTHLILEDDARLLPGWAEAVGDAFRSGLVPADWEILFLGGVLPRNRDLFDRHARALNRLVGRIDQTVAFGTNPRGYFHFCAYAYLLNARGARRLLDSIREANGVPMQADFLAAWTSADTATPRPVYLFHPLLAESFQDSEPGMARPYSEDLSPSEAVDSDIWMEREFLDAERAWAVADVGGPYDIRQALIEAEAQMSKPPPVPEPEPAAAPTGQFRRIVVGELAALGEPEGCAVAFCVDARFFAPASVAILSLAGRGNCRGVPVFVFSENVSEGDAAKFRELAASVPVDLTLVEFGEGDLAGLPQDLPMGWARLLVPGLLRGYRHVLYLDSDLLVLGALDGIFSGGTDGCALAAVHDPLGGALCGMEQFQSGSKGYFNAGVLLIDTREWMRRGYGERALALAAEHAAGRRRFEFREQCLLNKVADGAFAVLPKECNWMSFDPRHCSPGWMAVAPHPSLSELAQVRILHFTGASKPWMPGAPHGIGRDLHRMLAAGSPWRGELLGEPAPASPAPAPAGEAPRPRKFRMVWDYVSPNFRRVQPDAAFPNMAAGDPGLSPWPFLRREIPHTWYVDRRAPVVGFLGRDEASIVHETALAFAGKRCLEVGCWTGWSAAHLLMAGVDLDIVDPLLANARRASEIHASLAWALGRSPRGSAFRLHPGLSPGAVARLAADGRKWSLAFIDGNHEGNGPLRDADEIAKHMEPDALVLFHDLASPAVAAGLDFLRARGWHTVVYSTMQIMGAAWRGNARPVAHQPDPLVDWKIPPHLAGYDVSGMP